MDTSRNIAEASVERIFRFDKSIRFVVLLASDGTAIAVSGRPGVNSLEPENETNTVFMRAALAIQMSAPMNRYHGRIRTAIIVREKITLISFVISEKIMLISADPDFRLEKVEKLGRLIDQLSMNLS